MCQHISPLGQTRNGYLMHCNTCRLYQLTFGQFYMDLDEDEFWRFKDRVDSLDTGYWEERYSDCTLKRKIPLSTGQENFSIMLNKAEVEELRELLDFRAEREPDIIKADEVDYTLILN